MAIESQTQREIQNESQEASKESQEASNESQEASEGTTFLRTCFNGINTLSGVGILSIPYALSRGGWLSLILILLVPVMCFYTGLILHRCLRSHPQSKTYLEIGELAFGRTGRLIISTFMYLEPFLVDVEFLILEGGDNFHKLFPTINGFTIGLLHIGGKQNFVFVHFNFCVAYDIAKQFGVVSIFSAGEVLASIILVLSVFSVGTFSVGTFNGIGFHERGDVWNWSGIPAAISLYTFCYGAWTLGPLSPNTNPK